MKKPLALLGAFLAMLPAGPLLLLEGRVWPDTSCAAVSEAWLRIFEIVGRLYHDLKNLMTELFRCDAQWWAKETLFVVWVLLIATVIATVCAWRGRRT
jgi:hypothetical protein